MSHIVKIQTEVRDAAAVRAACQRRQLPVPVDGTHKLFSGKATGLAVQLPDWRYPVVCELTSGKFFMTTLKAAGVTSNTWMALFKVTQLRRHASRRVSRGTR
jgi:hypothetical protein